MPDEEDRRKEREGLEEWLRMNRAQTARRDLSDAAPEAVDGNASTTQLEALDRAAHIPAYGERPETSVFSAEERRIFAEQKRDLAELYPAETDHIYPPVAPPPSGTWERMQYDDLKQFATEKKEAVSVTPEQKANVDRALADTKISDAIGGASDGAAKPKPNDPQPVETARDIGKDLQKAGLTVDK